MHFSYISTLLGIYTSWSSYYYGVFNYVYIHSPPLLKENNKKRYSILSVTTKKEGFGYRYKQRKRKKINIFFFKRKKTITTL